MRKNIFFTPIKKCENITKNRETKIYVLLRSECKGNHTSLIKPSLSNISVMHEGPGSSVCTSCIGISIILCVSSKFVNGHLVILGVDLVGLLRNSLPHVYSWKFKNISFSWRRFWPFQSCYHRSAVGIL